MVVSQIVLVQVRQDWWLEAGKTKLLLVVPRISTMIPSQSHAAGDMEVWLVALQASGQRMVLYHEFRLPSIREDATTRHERHAMLSFRIVCLLYYRRCHD